MLTEREARQAPGGEIQHDGQVELALPGGDLGQVPTPALIDLLGGEVPAHEVRYRCGGLVWAGEAAPLSVGDRPCRPWRAIDAATVFFDTAHPAATRSSHTRGDP
jgi:hypothetical protein